MNPNTVAEITGVASVLAAILTGAGVPLWLRWRTNRGTSSATQVVSWETMNTRLDAEARDLRDRLEKMDRDHAAAMRRLDDGWQAKLDQRDRRITDQQAEIDALRAQLAARP